jgi:hypothetical protein
MLLALVPGQQWSALCRMQSGADRSRAQAGSVTRGSPLHYSHAAGDGIDFMSSPPRPPELNSGGAATTLLRR